MHRDNEIAYWGEVVRALNRCSVGIDFIDFLEDPQAALAAAAGRASRWKAWVGHHRVSATGLAKIGVAGGERVAGWRIGEAEHAKHDKLARQFQIAVQA